LCLEKAIHRCVTKKIRDLYFRLMELSMNFDYMH
jgi:hypothetical protein